MATILVTDGDQRSALAAVRSLGRAGHRVRVCSRSGRSLAGASRFASGESRVPDVEQGAEAFARAVRALAAELACDLVLPMTDPSATALLDPAYADAAEGAPPREPYRLAMPGVAAYTLASDKAELMRLAREEGVPVPEQIAARPDETEAAVDFAEATGWPVILKPARSAVVTEGRLLRTGVRIAADADAVVDALRSLPAEAGPMLVQRRIRGPGLGAFVLALEGEVVALFAHRRLREKPPTGGVSVYRESVPVRSDLEAHTRALMRRLAWTGVAMVEFKEETETGVPYLMEINARFWGSLQLAIDAGVDFPRLLADALLSGESPSAGGYRIGVRSRWLWGDVDHLLWMLRAPSGYRDLHPTLPSRLGALGRFLLPWRPGDRWEVARASDPRPFLRESATWVADLFR